MKIDHYDLLVVGAGPAGLSATVAARSCGLEVAIVDEQSAIGGQIFRNIHLPYTKNVLDNHDYQIGNALIKEFSTCGADFFPNTNVWGMQVNALNNEISCNKNGKPEKITASKVLYAIGGMERAVPFKGWTLPGVMTAGAAEIMLRSGSNLENYRDGVVLAGNGPLLLSLANHLLDHNIKILAWLDTGKFQDKLLSIIHMGKIYNDIPYLKRGMKMALRILKKVPIIQGAQEIEAHGQDYLEKVSYTKRNSRKELFSNCLIRHENVIPRAQIASALDLQMDFDSVQRYWHPKTDFYGRTSLNDIYMTGDGAFVHGGEAAISKGYLSGLVIARDLGVISSDEAAVRGKPNYNLLLKLIKARNYLRYVFAPNKDIFNVPDDVVVCRCECVTVADVRQAVKEGYNDPNEVKRMTRIGMGPCQGKMCGAAVAEIIAQERGVKIEKINMLKSRQPFNPVSLSDYCSFYKK